MRNSVGLKLGSLTLDVPFFQASLSSYSNYAMRTLARRFGCPFIMADMMLAKSAAYPRVLRKTIFRPGSDEHPIGVQILGRKPGTMAKAARDFVSVGYDVIDLNFACPAPKALRWELGGALLNDPDTVIDILKAVRDVVSVPVLMKFRIGVDRKPESLDNFWRIVNSLVEHGADAIMIHERTVSERYSGKADWNVSAAVKSRLHRATIVGSGDIFDAAAVVELMKRAGLDGFIVARGAIGDPWIFRDLRCVWENLPLPAPPEAGEQRLVMLEHFELILRDYTEKKVVCIFRNFAVGYVCRHPRRKPVLISFMKARTRADVENAINTWYTNRNPGA